MRGTRIWFHNGTGGSLARRLMSKVIQIRQGWCVHVEGQPFDSSYEGGLNPLSISSRGFERGKHPNGVTWKRIDYSRHPERWYYMDIEEEISQQVLNWTIGHDYDYRGAILGGSGSPIKEYCSEELCLLCGWEVMYPTALFNFLRKNYPVQRLKKS